MSSTYIVVTTFISDFYDNIGHKKRKFTMKSYAKKEQNNNTDQQHDDDRNNYIKIIVIGDGGDY